MLCKCTECSRGLQAGQWRTLGPASDTWVQEPQLCHHQLRVQITESLCAPVYHLQEEGKNGLYLIECVLLGINACETLSTASGSLTW